MGTRKKRHLIAGTIIGGLLLAATTQTGNSFALSDTPSAGDSSTATTTSQQTPSTTPDTSSTSGKTPTNTSNDPPKTDPSSVAGGSKATQTANTAAGVSSGQHGSTNPSNTTTSSTVSNNTAPQPNKQPSSDSSSVPTNNGLTNTTTDNNKVKSTAQTGDASVEHTSTGGNATTGNASAVATLINSIASSTNLSGGNIPTATYNVNGTQNGDIVINPEDILAAMNNGSVPTPVNCAPGTTTTDNNAAINNLVNLLAQSGNAKVTDNGVGGDATSGNATTEADIVNMIQDLVSNKGAFLGVVNINGNLNGNINLPASDVNALLTPTQGGSSTPANTSATNNANINNNVTLTAISGNAAVTNNGSVGNASSGNASTILNENNIINCQIVGGNLLLVFVNVMGHWYGALLSEPAGATTASIGGGITKDSLIPTSQTTATNNSTINNNVNLTSISGNATVGNNGVGGNATTGNATAIADVTNILGSQINLSGWLGILIINVFGTWNGSVGIQPTSSTSAPVSSTGNGSSPQHDVAFSGSNHHNTPGGGDSGYSYFVVNPPQSFEANQFELASAHIPSATVQLPSSNVLGESIRPAAITTINHDSRPSRHLAADFILAGIGAALALTGGVTRLFIRRPQK